MIDIGLTPGVMELRTQNSELRTQNDLFDSNKKQI